MRLNNFNNIKKQAKVSHRKIDPFLIALHPVAWIDHDKLSSVIDATFVTSDLTSDAQHPELNITTHQHQVYTLFFQLKSNQLAADTLFFPCLCSRWSHIPGFLLVYVINFLKALHTLPYLLTLPGFCVSFVIVDAHTWILPWICNRLLHIPGFLLGYAINCLTYLVSSLDMQ